MRNPPRRRRVHRVVLAAIVLPFALGTLSGCMGAPVPVPSDTAARIAEATGAPTDSPPVFASNVEALAGAKAAYENYLSLGDSVPSMRSESWDGYLDLTTGVEREGLIRGRELMEENGWAFTGVTRFDSMTIQSSRALPDSTWEIRAYLCLDLSSTDTVNKEGQSVVKSDRSVRSPMVVVFVAPDKNSRQLLISESPIWSGSNFCS
jgi:hypothetical protein